MSLDLFNKYPCFGPCIDCGKPVQILACYQIVRLSVHRTPIVERPICWDCYRKRQNAEAHGRGADMNVPPVFILRLGRAVSRFRKRGRGKLNKLILIGDAVEKIHDLTEAPIPAIVDALIGVAWDEEDARRIKAYHAEEES